MRGPRGGPGAPTPARPARSSEPPWGAKASEAPPASFTIRREEGPEGRLAVALASEARGDAAGVWFRLGPLVVRAPLGERLELWPAGMRGVPEEVTQDAVRGAVVLGRHEQRLFGFRFVTHHYALRRC